MADSFDPYREALVVEFDTVWPADFAELSLEQKGRIEAALHADAASCKGIEYVRTHTGFCRTITVSQADIDRVKK